MLEIFVDPTFNKRITGDETWVYKYDVKIVNNLPNSAPKKCAVFDFTLKSIKNRGDNHCFLNKISLIRNTTWLVWVVYVRQFCVSDRICVQKINEFFATIMHQHTLGWLWLAFCQNTKRESSLSHRIRAMSKLKLLKVIPWSTSQRRLLISVWNTRMSIFWK